MKYIYIHTYIYEYICMETLIYTLHYFCHRCMQQHRYDAPDKSIPQTHPEIDYLFHAKSAYVYKNLSKYVCICTFIYM